MGINPLRGQEISILEFRQSGLSGAALVAFIERMDGAFEPPLSQRVIDQSTVRTLADYVKKVLHFGYVFLAAQEGRLAGLIVLYANDTATKTAYIPLLAVAPEYCGRGLGKRLVLSAIQKAAEQGMVELRVKTWPGNLAARRIYEGLGFEIEKCCPTDIYFKKRLAHGG